MTLHVSERKIIMYLCLLILANTLCGFWLVLVSAVQWALLASTQSATLFCSAESCRSDQVFSWVRCQHIIQTSRSSFPWWHHKFASDFLNRSRKETYTQKRTNKNKRYRNPSFHLNYKIKSKKFCQQFKKAPTKVKVHLSHHQVQNKRKKKSLLYFGYFQQYYMKMTQTNN